MPFQLHSPYQPAGDQPQAINQLVQGIQSGRSHQVLLGVTGSGKTFTMANVIERTQKPTLVIAHNKTLAAQLYQEFRDFFPENAVSYFVSYYDYYQPEAYLPSSDTYIEKEATINDEIDKLRLSTTTQLLTRSDVIVVASVSCIYNLGSPVEYGKYILEIIEGQLIDKRTLLLSMEHLQYDRSDLDVKRGTWRERGEAIEIWPAYEDRAVRIRFFESTISSINWIDPTTGENQPRDPQFAGRPFRLVIYPAKHYVVDPTTQKAALEQIKQDLDIRLKELEAAGNSVAAFRLKQKVHYDIESIEQFGFVNGIENYSRYFDGRKPGQPPYSLLEYFRHNVETFNTNGFLTIIDESHMSIPQIKGMYRGDEARKKNLIDYGFRLPSALDNRPLRYDEFAARVPQVLAVSATPAEFEIVQAGGQVVEQLVRPTGLTDPTIELRQTKGQVEDLVVETVMCKSQGQRVLITTLTKRMAEVLTEYLNDEQKIRELLLSAKTKLEHSIEQSEGDSDTVIWQGEELPVDQMDIGPIDHHYFGHLKLQQLPLSRLEKITALQEVPVPKVAYLHSDVETLDRSDILADLRSGVYDVLVGINLLREGLDLPEVSLVAILDADKEGFLRSTTSLIQTMGRAARHLEGHVILYADNLTGSMKAAISETARRRRIQIAYNLKHHITPTSINKPIRDQLIAREKADEAPTKHTQLQFGDESLDLLHLDPSAFTPDEKKVLMKDLTKRMKQAALDLDFEAAVLYRDSIQKLQ